MELWKKLDLFGRAIVLLAIGFQISLVSELRSVQQRGDIYYLMENQSWMASMIYKSSSSNARSEIRNDISKPYSQITLFSEWEKSGLHNEVRIVNILFIVAFLLGSILLITGRYLEIKGEQSNT